MDNAMVHKCAWALLASLLDGAPACLGDKAESTCKLSLAETEVAAVGGGEVAPRKRRARCSKDPIFAIAR